MSFVSFNMKYMSITIHFEDGVQGGKRRLIQQWLMVNSRFLCILTINTSSGDSLLNMVTRNRRYWGLTRKSEKQLTYSMFVSYAYCSTCDGRWYRDWNNWSLSALIHFRSSHNLNKEKWFKQSVPNPCKFVQALKLIQLFSTSHRVPLYWSRVCIVESVAA